MFPFCIIYPSLVWSLFNTKITYKCSNQVASSDILLVEHEDGLCPSLCFPRHHNLLKIKKKGIYNHAKRKLAYGLQTMILKSDSLGYNNSTTIYLDCGLW